MLPPKHFESAVDHSQFKMSPRDHFESTEIENGFGHIPQGVSLYPGESERVTPLPGAS